MTLQTRKPTGVPAYPLIALEGEPKAGKSYQALLLSASDRVGRSFVFDMGDSTADEYGALGRYEIVDLTGTYHDLLHRMREAVAEPMADGKPNVIVLDSGSDLWGTLKDWASTRARNSKSNKERIAADPDYAVDVSSNYWNDAADRWRDIIDLIRRWPGIGVVCCDAEDKTEFEAGQPTKRKIWTVEAHRSFEGDATAIVHLRRSPRTATLAGVRKLGAGRDTSELTLPLDNALEYLVFEIIGAGGAGFAVPAAARSQVGFPKVDAMNRVLAAVKAHNGDLTEDEAKTEAGRVWRAGNTQGREEFTADELADILTLVTVPPEPPTSAPPAAPPATQEAPAPDGAPDPAEAHSGAQGPADGDDPSTDPPPEVDRVPTSDMGWLALATVEQVETAAAEVKAMTGSDITNRLANAGRRTAGKVEDRQQALVAYLVRLELDPNEEEPQP